MTAIDPPGGPSAVSDSSGAPAEREPDTVPSRLGEPAPPGTYEGRAHAFRERQSVRRSTQREQVGAIVVVAIIVLGVYAIVTARPFHPSSGNVLPPQGPPIVVSLAAPVPTNLTCGGGGTAFAEKVVWTGSTAPVTTGDLTVGLYEPDHDFIPNHSPVVNVTQESLCAGPAPTGNPIQWYVVAIASNGTSILTYQVAPGWSSLTGENWNIVVQNGTALTLVTGANLAQSGYSLKVWGFSNGSTIGGSVVF